MAYARTGHGGQGRNVKRGILFADRPTDIRNLYVPMSRGTDSNEAFLVTIGEQTALDVFIRSMTTDWIDLPAHARQDELNNTKPHRPGLLDGDVLRRLFEQRFDLVDALERAERDIERVPDELRAEEGRLKLARRQLDDLAASGRGAESVLARYDRPLHRRKHEGDIAAANRELRCLPDQIEAVQLSADASTERIDQLRQTQDDATQLLRRRPVLHATLEQNDDLVSHDLRVRTRIARREQPGAITDTLGRRPSTGRIAESWDRAAGSLAQHQAAFELGVGLGRRPSYRERGPYADSWHHVDDLIEPIRPAAALHRSIEIDSPGIDLG